MAKSSKALRTIGEVVDIIGVPAHVIRFWEAKFSNLKPVKYNNIRYFSAENIKTLEEIKNLLYVHKYSIKEAIAYFNKPKTKVNILEKVRKNLLKARERLNKLLHNQI